MNKGNSKFWNSEFMLYIRSKFNPDIEKCPKCGRYNIKIVTGNCLIGYKIIFKCSECGYEYSKYIII